MSSSFTGRTAPRLAEMALAKKDSGASSRELVLHLTAGLDRGGAEMVLLRLLAHPSAQVFRHRVLSLTAGGSLRGEMEAVTEEVFDIGMRRGRPGPLSARRLVGEARRRSPDLLVGWMYHGNLAATALRPWLRKPTPIVWNIGHSADQLSEEKRLTAAIIRYGRWFVPGTARVVFNSGPSAESHRAIGYPTEKFEVIPNGIDCDRFRPAPEARRRLREVLGVAPQTRVVGRVGRLHPVKDYPGLIEAAGRLEPDLHWLLIGPEVTEEDAGLRQAIQRAGLEGRCHLWGERGDLPDILPGLDLFCSNSLSEGSPNVVAEGMACGLPCVVTDAGTSAELVGSTGLVVPPGDPPALAAALEQLLTLPKEELRMLGEKARCRVAQLYSADEIFPRHIDLWRRCLVGAETSP